MKEDAMKRLLIVVCLLGLAGCYNHTKIKSPLGETDSHGVIAPFVTTASLEDKPNSSWKTCMAKYDGYDGAESICTERMEASRPGALPLCGTLGAMAPAYYGGYGYGGYGNGYAGTGYVRLACRQPKP